MKISFFDFEFTIQKKNKLSEKAAQAKKEQAWSKIKKALEAEKKEGKIFSEYKIQKISGVSINTIKKYRKDIKNFRG